MGLGLPVDVSACCHVWVGHLPETPESIDEAGGLSGPFFSCEVIGSGKSQELIT